ncbi:RNA polymerase sigma factor SigB [Neobacillus bataviensis LMG 21833]|uniref:RNA polymerase sigma factor SigB n=1 Tax=Neobacillus bataviensis LMG 21833 TaxID=1117379 RepID=K6DE23_9BACI|nr:RNA polymerase sigma factor SigB [Neobacillus bataviensis]EKN66534.1 RNA polymerase sigma factor SigB [Neobacillus bataviensis LMG 21833]
MTQPSQTGRRTKEEIDALILAFQQDEDPEAQNVLVEHYNALVASLARKYSKGKNFHEDIMQVAMIGLLSAIRRYDPALGRSFESFLIPTVIGEIKRFLRDKTWGVHVPRRIKETWPKIKTVVDELTNQYQRSPKIHEIAEYMEISEEELLEAMEMGKSYQTASVDQTIETGSEGSTVTTLDIVGTHDEGYERVDQKLLLESVLHVLSDREREVIHYTFVENKSQKETGEYLGISQMHVSRLQKKALEKLRKTLRGQTPDALMR